MDRKYSRLDVRCVKLDIRNLSFSTTTANNRNLGGDKRSWSEEHHDLDGVCRHGKSAI